MPGRSRALSCEPVLKRRLLNGVLGGGAVKTAIAVDHDIVLGNRNRISEDARCLGDGEATAAYSMRGSTGLLLRLRQPIRMLFWKVDRALVGSLRAAELAALPENFRAEALARSQVVSPSERVSREITETTTENRDQLGITIADETGRAKVSQQPKRATVELQPSGAF